MLEVFCAPTPRGRGPPSTGPAGECFTRAWPWLRSVLRSCHCAAPACIHHSPPFFAFSPGVHVPKSIYEGNFGCGYLKERRASGLVFCENTASVYRALFVSSRCFLPCVFLNGDGGVWTGTSVRLCRRGMLFTVRMTSGAAFACLCLFVECASAVTNG